MTHRSTLFHGNTPEDRHDLYMKLLGWELKHIHKEALQNREHLLPLTLPPHDTPINRTVHTPDVIPRSNH